MSVPTHTPAAQKSATPSAVPSWVGPLVIFGLIAVAFNLRPAITSLGAFLEEVRGDLGINGTLAGFLTALPDLCFAGVGLTAPALARRFGPGRVVLAGMSAIAVGLVVRALSPNAVVFVLTSVVSLAGIAVTNVLMPVLIRRFFPQKIGTMTGVYSMALAVGSAVPAALTVPIAHGVDHGWRTGLGMWALTAVIAVLPWLMLLRDKRATAGHLPEEGSGSGAKKHIPIAKLARSRTSWALMIFFGLQATNAYAAMGWMPQIYRDAGLSSGLAGVLLAVMLLVGVPLSFVLPALAARRDNQVPFAVVLGTCGLAGYAGLAFAPAGAPWVWTILLGLSNSSFPLAITMIGLRSRSGQGTVALSTFAQSFGYLLAVPGPILVGTLYDATDGWGVPLAFLAVLLVPQMIAGAYAGRNRFIEDEV